MICDLRGRAGAVQLEVNALWPGDPRTRPAGGRAGRGGRPDHRCRAAADGAGQAGRSRAPAPWCWTAAMARCWRWRTNPSFDPALFNSGVAQAQWAEWTQRPARAADQQGDGRAVRAGLDVQDGGGDGRRWSRGTDHRQATASIARAISTWAMRGFIAGGKGGHGTLDLRGGLKNSCDVLFLRDGAAHRDRPHRGDGAPASAWARTGDRSAGPRTGLIPTREWRIGQGHAWNIGDTVVSAASARATSR